MILAPETGLPASSRTVPVELRLGLEVDVEFLLAVPQSSFSREALGPDDDGPLAEGERRELGPACSSTLAVTLSSQELSL